MLHRIRPWSWRLGCALWGHVVDNRKYALGAGSRQCRCGADYLREDGSRTHLRHTLRCFLRHHTYVRLAVRDRVHEYVCIRCGHPLVYPQDSDPFEGTQIFGKKVRYACGLFGHRVQAVASRDGFMEYACHCGHSFLKADDAGEVIRHPLLCVLTAHRVQYLTRRRGFLEFVCLDCGHPFCFSEMPQRDYAESLRATQVVMQR